MRALPPAHASFSSCSSSSPRLGLSFLSPAWLPLAVPPGLLQGGNWDEFLSHQ